MPNTSITLQSIVDFSRTFGELTPVLGVSGFSMRPAIDIANDVMATILSQAFPWKWNRAVIAPFYLNGFQQDYAMLNTNFAWIEHAYAVDFANTSNPKPIWTVEAVRDLEVTSNQFGIPGQICWLPNNQLQYGTWPGANTEILSPVDRASKPNSMTQIRDVNGNLLVVTTYGTTGSSAPSAPSNSAAGTTITDGSVVWTVLDPYAPGFRVSPLPPQSGVVYQINVVAQQAPPTFTKLSQTLAPLPDQFVKYFKAGFVALCYRHAVEPQVRQKFPIEYDLWMKSLQEELRGSDRERDAAGFYPTQSIMSGQAYIDPGPAWPFGGY